jgi:hypothetical protein
MMSVDSRRKVKLEEYGIWDLEHILKNTFSQSEVQEYTSRLY